MIGPALEWMTSPVTKLQLYGQPKWLKHVVWAIDVDIPNEVRTLHAGNHILQIMNRSVSKADALEALCGQTGTARENVMAIGDNANDASMIKWAGLGVCVGNGHPVSLQLADHVVADNEHDGVAQALHELIELGMTPNQW
jgi:hydroxymethylpyrimidine pyrophosphatase-like HAD family hydrolase